MDNEILGWIANVCFIYGVYTIGIKNIKGFYFNAVGNFLYVLQALNMNNGSLFWLSIGLIVLNIKGIYEWRKEDELQRNRKQI